MLDLPMCLQPLERNKNCGFVEQEEFGNKKMSNCKEMGSFKFGESLHPMGPAGWVVSMSSQCHGKRHISASVLCHSVTESPGDVGHR